MILDAVIGEIGSDNSNPFYFNREGTAYLFAKNMVNGPLPVYTPMSKFLSTVSKNTYLVLFDSNNNSNISKYLNNLFSANYNYCEISKYSASILQVSDGDFITVKLNDDNLKAEVLITDRVKDFSYNDLFYPLIYVFGYPSSKIAPGNGLLFAEVIKEY